MESIPEIEQVFSGFGACRCLSVDCVISSGTGADSDSAACGSNRSAGASSFGDGVCGSPALDDDCCCSRSVSVVDPLSRIRLIVLLATSQTNLAIFPSPIVPFTAAPSFSSWLKSRKAPFSSFVDEYSGFGQMHFTDIF